METGILGIGGWGVEVWKVLEPYGEMFGRVALVFIGVLIFVELTREAIDIATGRGFHLDRKLIVFFLVLGILLSYIPISKQLWAAGHRLASTGYEDFDHASKALWSQNIMIGQLRSLISGLGAGLLTSNMIVGLLTAYHLYSETKTYKTILFASNRMVDVSLLCALIAYALILCVGPLFIMFFLSGPFRSLGWQWATQVLTYLVFFPIMGICLKISVLFMEESGKALEKSIDRIGFGDLDAFFYCMRGPLMAVALVFVAFKLAGTLTGGLVAGQEGVAPLLQSMGFFHSQQAAAKKGLLTSLTQVAGGAGKAGGIVAPTAAAQAGQQAVGRASQMAATSAGLLTRSGAASSPVAEPAKGGVPSPATGSAHPAKGAWPTSTVASGQPTTRPQMVANKQRPHARQVMAAVRSLNQPAQGGTPGVGKNKKMG